MSDMWYDMCLQFFFSWKYDKCGEDMKLKIYGWPPYIVKRQLVKRRDMAAVSCYRDFSLGHSWEVGCIFSRWFNLVTDCFPLLQHDYTLCQKLEFYSKKRAHDLINLNKRNYLSSFFKNKIMPQLDQSFQSITYFIYAK